MPLRITGMDVESCGQFVPVSTMQVVSTAVCVGDGELHVAESPSMAILTDRSAAVYKK